MFAKSFIALDGNVHLTSARTALSTTYNRYTCHLCGSALQYHPGYDTERPWFEHAREALTENGQHHCPYVKPNIREVRLIRHLQHQLPEAIPRVPYPYSVLSFKSEIIMRSKMTWVFDVPPPGCPVPLSENPF